MKTQITFPDGFVKNLLDPHIQSNKQYLNRSHFVLDACKEKILNDAKYYEG